MAGAIVPAIMSFAPFAPDLIKLIAGLVHHEAPIAQANYPASGSGPIRLTDVLATIKTKIAAAVAAGQIDKSKVPDDATMTFIINCMVAALDVAGLLTPAAVSGLGTQQSAAAANSQSVTLSTGQSLLINVR